MRSEEQEQEEQEQELQQQWMLQLCLKALRHSRQMHQDQPPSIKPLRRTRTDRESAHCP